MLTDVERAKISAQFGQGTGSTEAKLSDFSTSGGGPLVWTPEEQAKLEGLLAFLAGLSGPACLRRAEPTMDGGAPPAPTVIGVEVKTVGVPAADPSTSRLTPAELEKLRADSLSHAMRGAGR